MPWGRWSAACLLAAAWLYWPSSAPARSPATLTGVITDPDGHPVSGAPVQARNLATRKVYRAVSAPSGAYRLAQLPTGLYDLAVPNIGVTLSPFERKQLTLQSAQTLDIRLEWGPNLGTAGDDASRIVASVRGRSTPSSGPAPMTPEGRPDLSGAWLGSDDPNPETPSLLPWAGALVKQRKQFDKVTDNPAAHCLPNAVPLAGPGFYKLVQTPALLIAMSEDVIGYRQVFLDGRAHPKDWDPSWTGHSIAQWQGDTLVIDTIGFNDRSWLDLYPHTEQLHTTERYRRLDLGHLQVQIAIEDPGTFVRPWKIHNVWTLAPQEDVLEYVCNENNKDLPHLAAH